MAMRIGVIKEHVGNERRVALSPEIIAKLTKLGCEIMIEAGAGSGANFADTAFASAGGTIATDRQTILGSIDLLLGVQPPSQATVAGLKEGATVIAFLAPHKNKELVKQFCDRNITTFGMELIPRVTRAQSMDALSSQATVAGYKAALLAANLSGRFLPMLTTAAGTIRPAKVLILGAGVAGLQAIATTKRLGAIVEAYDVRRAAKEEVESLGARFIGLDINASSEGGYARELTAEEKAQANALVAEHVAKADIVITTAALPGRTAPRLIAAEVIERMHAGAVIVDMAADSGGNCALSRAGEVITHHGVIIAGPVNLPSELPGQASEMYAKNLFNLLQLMIQEGPTLAPNWEDEIVAGTALTHAGAIVGRQSSVVGKQAVHEA